MRLKYFFTGRSWTLIIILIAALCQPHRLVAQEGGIEKDMVARLSGTEIVNLANIDLTYTPDHAQTFLIRNVITFSLNEETTAFIADDFNATVTVQVDYGLSSTSLYSFTRVLSLSYKKAAGIGYNPKQYISFTGAKYVKVTVTNVNAPTLSNGLQTVTLLLLQNEIRAQRFYDLDPTQSLAPVSLVSQPPTAPAPDALSINWQWPIYAGNNKTQLEWTWLEDELAANYQKSDGAIDMDLLFSHNATRVDLPADAASYTIPLFYDGAGFLYYRIRPVNVRPSGSTSMGPWSAVQPYHFAGHNNDLNWQVTTSFAEDGKRKSVVQYFDGSLRMRQVVTKDNSTNTAVAAETFYDGQGRPAVQILPAPGINNIVAYTKNLNLFNLQAENEDPALSFDLFVPGNDGATPPLQSISGTSRYYSASNPEIATDKSNQNLPDAQGYPYTVTRYTPDGTGRIMRQSGVGQQLAMGTGHETKYYYGGAAREELDGLFGTDVGDFSHYFKNMVSDANGQMSVSYVDMHGRTVATALAGNAPTGMDGLVPDETNYPGQAGTTINRNLLNKNTNVVKNNASIESFNTLLVPAHTDFNFRYALSPEALQLPQCPPATQPVCYDCMYDLEIAITDESGETAPIIRKFSNVSLSADNSCISPVTPFAKDPATTAPTAIANNVITFTVPLDAGSYSVRKTLTINESSLATFRDQYLAAGLCVNKDDLIQSIYSSLLTTSDCNKTPTQTPCEACQASLGGNFTNWKQSYTQDMGSNIPSDVDLQNIYTEELNRCQSLCSNVSHKLAAIRSEMLADMMPYSGQYAKGPTPLNPAPPSTSPYYTFDIFSTQTPAMQPFYKRPENSAGTSDYYRDANGNIDASIQPGTISAADFAAQFNPSWAEALLPHHPEYPRLMFVQQHPDAYYDWIENFDKVSTYAEATSGIYAGAGGHYENIDPFFALADASSKTNMSNSETTGAYINGLSMWQMAAGTAVCNTITDLQQRDQCYKDQPVQPPFPALTTDQLNETWNIFKGLYSAARTTFLNKHIEDHVPLTQADDLVNAGYILRFPTKSSQVNTQFGFTGMPTTDGGAPTADINAMIAANKTTTCSAYIKAWKQELSKCSQLMARPDAQQILTEITTGMETVCEKGLDEANPQGASSVAPSTPNDGSPRSFEDVINNVFAAHGITKDQYCNPFVIGFPKPHGKAPVFTKELISTLQQCTCDRYTQIRLNAITAGYDPNDLSSLNHYLDQIYHETLTQELFDGLQKCSVLGTTSCRQVPTHYQCDQPSPCQGALAAASTGGGSTTNSTGGSGDCVCYLPSCETITYISLASTQPKPAFLDCGYTGELNCATCADLSALTAGFKTYYNGMACAAAPIFGSDNLSPDQIGYNIAFEQYLNYHTGFSYSWMAYAKAAATAGCDLANYLTNTSTTNVICPNPHPLNDPTGYFYTPDPCQSVYDMAVAIATRQYEIQKAKLLADFEANYRSKCLGAKDIEQFTVEYKTSEYHYTLYYYDMAGNMVRTLSPRSARPNFSSTFIDNVETAKANNTVLRPAHINALASDYRFNSLDQVTAQHSPDGGTSNFWYDILGRLVVSQNQEQKDHNRFSYTLYDPLGRITEVGQKPQTDGMDQSTSQNVSLLDAWININGGTKEQITGTVYDVPAGFDMPELMTQQNLRNRVSYIYNKNFATDVKFYTASYYTYDVHGNVDILVQDYLGTGLFGSTHPYKKISYAYDLISGKVNGVDYQPGESDAFYHRYQYDAENRLTSVLTSRDKIVWEQDAAYKYYKHGPLARMELGQLRAQGLDYSYTLQGWLKGVNVGTSGGVIAGDNPGGSCSPGTALDDLIVSMRETTNPPTVYVARNSVAFDPGFESTSNDAFEAYTNSSLDPCIPVSDPGNGAGGGLSGMAESLPVALDAFNFSLHYYPGDFVPVGSATPNLGILPALAGQAAPLYNGNIAAMAVDISKLNGAKVYNYHYDQLNRIKRMDAFDGLNTASQTFTPVQVDDYKESISYDPNGNIMTYNRNGYQDGTHSRPMDNLTYGYYSNSNRLQHIGDNPSNTGNYTEDIDDQPNPSNYTYDAIGNLKTDVAAQVTNIDWTVYGKISSITRNGATIAYTYDASGNRLSKTAGGVTSIYVRDIQGNVLSVYQKSGSGDAQQNETNLYGSTRMGLVRALTTAPAGITLDGGFGTATVSTFTRGEKLFELTNHLGNVLATVTDKKIAVSSTGNSSLIDHYEADIANVQDYYPFGMQMPGRSFTVAGGGNYRYGFNGKENDNEVKGIGNQQDYGFRIYDPRIGKFLSVDPLSPKYPMLTPYQFASNRPIDGVDQDGLEYISTKDANISSAEKNKDNSYTLKIGDQTLHSSGIVSYNGNDYYNLGQNVYKTEKGVSLTGTSAQKLTSFFVTQDQMKRIFPSAKAEVINEVTNSLNTNMGDYGVDTYKKLSQFLGQVGAETWGLREFVEGAGSLSKSFQQICNEFKQGEFADNTGPYVRNQENFANWRYRAVAGNKGFESGDGYNFRGRGLFQLTGRGNYADFDKFYNKKYGSGPDFVANASLLGTNMNYATINGLWFFSSRVGTKLDLNAASVKQVTKIVNGGYNGLKTREKFYNAATKALY